MNVSLILKHVENSLRYNQAVPILTKLCNFTINYTGFNHHSPKGDT